MLHQTYVFNVSKLTKNNIEIFKSCVFFLSFFYEETVDDNGFYLLKKLVEGPLQRSLCVLYEYE